MKKAFVFLATGFEEAEAIGTIDVLRRGYMDVTVVSITADKQVKGAHGIEVCADQLFDQIDYNEADVLVLPGGMPGSSNLNAFDPLKILLVNQHQQGRLIAAICAAPLVLGGLGLLKGLRATCYPSFEAELIGAEITGESVVIDTNVITARGPGFVFDFALAILKVLKGKAISEEVASGLLLL